MIFGISTKLLRDEPMESRIRLAGALGYEALEFWIDDLLESELSLKEIRKLTDELHLYRSVHLRTEDLNIASFNEGIRRESVRQQKEGLRIAAELGAEHATLHPGPKTAKTKTIAQAWDRQLDSIRELAATAEHVGVCLCVEGMEKTGGEFVLTPNNLQRILTECHSPNLAVTLDLAHLQTLGDTAELLAEAKQLPVANVHISQTANGMPHRPVFEPSGEIQFDTVIPFLKGFYNGPLILEGYLPGKGKEIAEASITWYREVMGQYV